MGAGRPSQGAAEPGKTGSRRRRAVGKSVAAGRQAVPGHGGRGRFWRGFEVQSAGVGANAGLIILT